MTAREQYEARCGACGVPLTKYNLDPQNAGDKHQCGPKDRAAYQAEILKDIRKILLDFDERWRTRSFLR